jgi:hypothetical protein
MPFPVNSPNFNHNINNATLLAQQPPPIAESQPLLRPGAGRGIVNGMQVHMMPLSRSGFTSAFPTPKTAVIARRGHLPISPLSTQRILACRALLSQEAERTMHAISTLDLCSLEETHKVAFKGISDHINHFSRKDIEAIVEALDIYQSPDGDYFMMSVSAMGYTSLDNYLEHLGITNLQDVEQFIKNYGKKHESADTVLDKDYVDEIRDRINDRLTEPTRILIKYIQGAPRISDIPLLKGVHSGDNPVSTEVNGVNTIMAALNGKAINFNGFLSTTSSFHIASEFAGLDNDGRFGEPKFTVDLNKDSDESEALRRAALEAIQRNECEPNSIIYYFKSNNVAGISVNSTKASANYNSNFHASASIASEDEILLSPGHFFQPEQIVLYTKGVAMIGSLEYGKN